MLATSKPSSEAGQISFNTTWRAQIQVSSSSHSEIQNSETDLGNAVDKKGKEYTCDDLRQY